MTQHLLSLGCRRIAFAAAQLDARTLQRAQGYRECMQQAGVYDATLEWRNPQPSSLQVGAHMFEQIMSVRPHVDAIFFCNDDLAQGALLAAHRLGIAVPSQVAIAGFNDLPGSETFYPALTTVRTPRYDIGVQAATMLMGLMRGETMHASIDLGFEVVVRASTVGKPSAS
jgi:LacI family gluconate utilization system Gnt-I transcriptional repressor